MFFSVINASSRVIPTKQTPEAWRTWTDRGHDSALIATVWQFLLLPDVLGMLKACGKPLCKMLKDITKKKGGWFGAGSFDKNEQLLRLLEYSSSDAASHRAHHALPIMARVLLKLCSESEEIRERFKAHLEATRYCKVSASSSRHAVDLWAVPRTQPTTGSRPTRPRPRCKNLPC